MAGRSFSELKKDDLTLVKTAKEVTTVYAETQKEFSQSQLSEKYNLSESCVRKLMDYAIINSLVDLNIAAKVMNKSIENQQRNHPEAGGSSIMHHQKLIKIREEKKVQMMSRDLVKQIIESAVALKKDQPYTELVKNLNLESMRIFQLILERGIIENIASEYETVYLINRSLLKNNSIEIQSYFNELIKKRQEYKKSLDQKNSG